MSSEHFIAGEHASPPHSLATRLASPGSAPGECFARLLAGNTKLHRNPQAA